MVKQKILTTSSSSTTQVKGSTSLDHQYVGIVERKYQHLSGGMNQVQSHQKYSFEVLSTLDIMKVIPRDGYKKASLLLDRHQSRLEIFFLECINIPEDYWVVCL